jgi:hypothetical protein
MLYIFLWFFYYILTLLWRCGILMFFSFYCVNQSKYLGERIEKLITHVPSYYYIILSYLIHVMYVHLILVDPSIVGYINVLQRVTSACFLWCGINYLPAIKTSTKISSRHPYFVPYMEIPDKEKFNSLYCLLNTNT